jgi:hypothetical protein
LQRLLQPLLKMGQSKTGGVISSHLRLMTAGDTAAFMNFFRHNRKIVILTLIHLAMAGLETTHQNVPTHFVGLATIGWQQPLVGNSKR